MDPITVLAEKAQTLDFNAVQGDFNAKPVIHAEDLSDTGKRMLETYKPLLEAIEFNDQRKGILGTKQNREMYTDTYKLLIAEMVHMLLKTPIGQLQRESMVAGTDATTYHKQIIRTVLRAFPRLIAPQLVPVIPMTGPTARIYFELMKYDTTYASSSPNVAVGDTLDDLTKFNSGYAVQPAQLTDLNAIKLSLENYVEISEATHGLSATSSLQFEDDIATVHGRDYNNYMSDRLVAMLSWFIDRNVIGALVNAVPAANVVTWTRQPSINGTAWANLNPSERIAWRETIWRDAFIPARTKIFNNRYEYPNFAICGSLAAEDITGLSQFHPVEGDGSVTINVGGIRDLGALDNGSLRVLIDPQLASNLIILGVRPTEQFKPSVVWAPYRPIGFAPDLYYPRSLKHEKGAYTRFGIAKPTGTAITNHLGDGYAAISIF